MAGFTVTDPRGLVDDDSMSHYRQIIAYMMDRMEQRNVGMKVLRDYYGGNPPMPWVHKKAKAAYLTLIGQARCNFPLLVVDTVSDRLSVEGFRLDGGETDALVWNNIWQGNFLDIFSSEVQHEALVTGIGYASVTKPAEDVIIRGEVTEEVFHDPDLEADPLSAARVVKAWANNVTRTKYLRYIDHDVVIRMSAPWNPEFEADPMLFSTSWTLESIEANATGDIPIVPFLNRPTLDGGSTSEIRDLLPHFDKINTLTAQLLLAAELSAFRIRWATGIDIPTDANGNPIEPFDVAMNRLWTNREPDGRFGSFESTPLDPYQSAIDQAIQQVAAISRTPPFLLMGKVTNLSAEALKGTESGLVQKVRERQRSFGQSWQRVIRKALALMGDPAGEQVWMETMWRDPENVSEAQRVDALSKLYALGLPWKAVMERYGASPGEIVRWQSMRSDDLFARMLLATANQGLPQLSQPPQQPPATADQAPAQVEPA